MRFIKRINKRRIIAAIICFILLCLSLVFFYFCKARNEYYISFKDKLIIVLCIGLSTILTLTETKLNRTVSIIGEVLVILLTPYLAYIKLEPMVNSMENIKPLSLLFNYIIIACVLLVFYGLFQNAGLSVMLGGGLVYASYIVDYYTLAFRGSPLLVSDVLSIKTAAAVSGGYTYVLNDTIVTVFFEYALLVTVAFFLSGKKSKNARIVIAPVSMVVGILILCVLIRTDIVDKNGFRNSAFIPVQSAEENGLFLNCIVNLHMARLDEPKGYSNDAVKEIIENNHNENVRYDDCLFPNIIVIMNESFTDIDYLETVETSKETIPYFKSLKGNAITGTLVSSILGGNTPNSEFEFLTGCSMAFMPTGTVAYQQTISKDLPTVATMLKSNGYDTLAVHLYKPQYFDRKRIYPLLGIDKFVNEENYSRDKIVVDYPRQDTGYAADKSSFELIQLEYEKKEKESRVFCFCVTIQNHGGYWAGLNDISVIGQNNAYADEYVSLLSLTDEAFKNFIEYFETVDEPTIVCMYGDHQPYLFADDFVPVWDGYDYTDEEKRYMQSKVPFVIWANYDIEPCEMGEMSINYLGPTLLKAAKMPMSDYFWYLDKLRETLPVISAVGFVDKNGNHFSDAARSEYAELLKQYEYLQYNYLKGNVNREFYE